MPAVGQPEVAAHDAVGNGEPVHVIQVTSTQHVSAKILLGDLRRGRVFLETRKISHPNHLHIKRDVVFLQVYFFRRQCEEIQESLFLCCILSPH